MKTFLLIALTFTGIAFCVPRAQAHDWSYRSSCDDSYRDGYSYRQHSYYRGGYPRRGYYSSSYYRPSSRYYRPSRSYYSSDRYYPEHRHYFRPPLISFLFGF